MFASLFESSSIGVLEQVVGFTQARHNVLAGNVANLDTPGYQVRDLPPEVFHARLKETLAARRGGSSESLRAGRPAAMVAEVAESVESIVHHDGGNVSLEQQINELNKNHAQHALAVTILRSQFELLQAAISLRA